MRYSTLSYKIGSMLDDFATPLACQLIRKDPDAGKG